MARKITTEEEKIAKNLAKMVSDLRIDLDLVGVYLARISPSTSYNRLQVIAEAAEQEKVGMNDRANFAYTLFD